LEVFAAMETFAVAPDMQAIDMLVRLAESCGGGRDLVWHFRGLGKGLQ
jgi:hypothetical protein